MMSTDAQSMRRGPFMDIRHAQASIALAPGNGSRTPYSKALIGPTQPIALN
jgi:hypothetical protein